MEIIEHKGRRITFEVADRGKGWTTSQAWRWKRPPTIEVLLFGHLSFVPPASGRLHRRNLVAPALCSVDPRRVRGCPAGRLPST